MPKAHKRKKRKVKRHSNRTLSKLLTNFHAALRKAKKEPGGATHDNIVKHLKPL